VVQRIPVRIQFEPNQPLDRLLPGMSVVTSILTSDAGTGNGGK
jgi:membrane fusion protein (multidrug efflux system)